MHAAVEKSLQRSFRPDLVRLLARLGVIVALVAGGSLTGLQAASAAGATPDAYGDFVTTEPGVPVTITLAGEDADAEPLTFAIVTSPGRGTLGPVAAPVCDGFGYCTAEVVYTPPSGPSFDDSLTFTVNDGTLTSTPATVDISVVAPPVQITSSGPLTTIRTTPDLNCAVNHVGDTQGEWYGDTACATLVAVGTSLYGPVSIPAGSGATGAQGYQPFTPVSQTGPTGSGTQASPYVVTTVVDLGASLRLTQTDSYVVGQESYRTDLSLASRDGAPHDAIVYRAGDCYLQDSDVGLGQVFSGNAPNCKAEPGSTDPDRVEGFFPLTGGSHYLEAGFSEVWAAVGAKSQLPDTCRCAENIDNGIALSWPATIAATGTTNISSLTNFSPVGAVPVTLSKTADDAEVPAGAADGYTVTLTNPGAVPQTLTSITDTLPAGFTYVPGSSTGLTTTDPVVSGRDVTWSGSFSVPAATGSTPGTRTLHFGVTVAQQPGTYTNSVTGSGNGVTVLAATDVAPVTVTAADTTPPDTTITAGPSGTTADSTPTFSFTATEAGSTFECRLDGGAWASCTSPFTTAPLADGAHTFEVRATDAAGNTDPTPASRTFTVDTTPPDTTITDGPSGTTADSTPTFSFTGSGGATSFECRVDGGAWVSCTSPFTTASLADGAHTFDVRAIDGVGNTDPTPASRSFTVSTGSTPPDTTAPDTTITAGPSGTTADSTPTFSFTATEAGSTFQCRVDGGAWGTCTSPFTTASLADGPHTFEVRATDAAGNTDASPATRSFTVDTTPPDTTITDGPSGTTADSTPTFSFTATEAGSTFQCRIDGGAWASCASPLTTASLADGAHTFEVRATDGVGNTDPTPASRTFTVTTVTTVPTCFGKAATIVGTPGNDVLTGTRGNDVIVGLGGKDKISGGGGKDLICGGDGNDRLRGAGGDDRLDGGAGNDDLGGGGGDDEIVGGDGNDRLKGNGGDDELDGGAGDDLLRGAAGDDVLIGGPGNDRLYGQGGNDDLSGGPGKDKLDGGPGRDRGDGGGGQDVIVRCER